MKRKKNMKKKSKSFGMIFKLLYRVYVIRDQLNVEKKTKQMKLLC